MIHLEPLPGSPRYGGSMAEVVDNALKDATCLVDAGFPALLVENFGDAPYFPDRVPPETVAAMTVALESIASTGVPLGINVLRNDALAAVGIAAATGAAFIRVNVLTGLMLTDQGPIVGRGAEVLRRRTALDPGVEIWADVMVKHASAPEGADAGQIALETVERSLADAVIVSGPATGSAPDSALLRAIASAVPDGTRVVIGSGADMENLGRLLEFADSVIVGSSIRVDGRAGNRPDPLLAEAFVEQARERGVL